MAQIIIAELTEGFTVTLLGDCGYFSKYAKDSDGVVEIVRNIMDAPPSYGVPNEPADKQMTRTD